jgi:CHAD domain-containing protein
MTHLQKQSGALQRQLNVALAKIERDVPAKAVHRLRTTARRIQTLISTQPIRLRDKDRQAIRELERIRRRGGKVRDLDVQIPLLRVLSNRSVGKDCLVLRQALLKKRTKRAERLAATARTVVQSKFCDRLYRVLHQMAPTAESPSHADEQDLLVQAQLKLEQLGAVFGGDPQPSSKRLHQLRIALKHTRYLAELSQPSQARDELIARLKFAHKVLGEWRDWELLAKTAEKQFAHRTNCALVAEIRARLAGRRALVLPALNRLFLLSPERKQPQPASSDRALAQSA